MEVKKTRMELKESLAYVLPSVVSIPYYRKKYGIERLSDTEAADYILDHFYELPLLTREEVPDIKRTSAGDGRYARLAMTSGTCGVSNVIEWCDEDVNAMMRPIVRWIKELGISGGDYSFSTIPVGMSMYGICAEKISEGCGLTQIEVERVSPSGYEVVEILIRKHKPKLLITTFAEIKEMMQYLPLKGALQSVEAAIIAGTMSSQADIEYLEESLHCKALDVLGSTECNVYGAQEKGCSGFHLFEPQAVEMEIVEADEYGTGKCVVTSLWNKRMPLVRYINGDRGQLTGHCSCGHKGRIFKLAGRTTDTCRIRGTEVGAECFEQIAESLGVNTIFQALVYKEEYPQRIQLNIVDSPVYWTRGEILRYLIHTNVALRRNIAEGLVDFNISFIEESELIDIDEQGKWRLIVEC